MYLKLIYTIFIGVLLATFVGVGIDAFYPEPKYPDCYRNVKPVGPDTIETPEIRQQREACDAQIEDHQKIINVYSRNVSIIALIAAIIFLVASVWVLPHTALIADGVLVGGVLTLLYGIIRGFGTDDNMFRFIVVSIGLVVALGLGYYKFGKDIK